jgi:aminocarboxymuconate-semialdehyde decarboxylase
LIVDVHSHVRPASTLAELERNPDRFDAGFDTGPDGTRYLVVKGRRRGPLRDQWFDVERRLSDMDAAGIDVQVLSPTPSLLSYWAEPSRAAEIAAAMNDGIADMVSQTDRFWGIGQLPLQSAELSLAELDHVLELGLSGIEVGANVESKELDDESLEPVWARLSELEMPVFVHPVNPTLIPRLEPYHLTNLIGNPLDTTIALSRLILSGVLIRHPGVRFYFAHAGGFMPYLYGRIDHAYRAREDTSSVIDVLPSSLLERCWFDTIAHAEPPLRYLISSMGDEHVVVGTDYPADMSDANISQTLADLGLSDEARARIEHENAERLFDRVAVADSA